MRLPALTAFAVACLWAASSHAQTISARSLAMGGALLPGSAGVSSANVAYRAVPSPAGSARGVSLPLGLIALAKHPPEWSRSSEAFNAWALANLLYNPPWHLQLSTHELPASDLTLELGRDALAVELGSLAAAVPDRETDMGFATNGPAPGAAWRGVFVAAAPYAEVRNVLELNDALTAVLAEAEPVAPRTTYTILDRGLAQVAAGVHAGWAGRLTGSRPGSNGLWAGARLKLLRGLAFGGADLIATTTTGDTLFSGGLLRFETGGRVRDARPAGGSFATGADAGVVWCAGPLHVGAGLDDIGTRFHWRGRESTLATDSTGRSSARVLDEHASWTSYAPLTWTVNAAWATPAWTIAADVSRTGLGAIAHAGIEAWFGPIALRGGALLDRERQWLPAGGLGARMGRAGLDLGVAAHRRNLTRAIEKELALGVVWYPKEAAR